MAVSLVRLWLQTLSSGGRHPHSFSLACIAARQHRRRSAGRLRGHRNPTVSLVRQRFRRSVCLRRALGIGRSRASGHGCGIRVPLLPHISPRPTKRLNASRRSGRIADGMAGSVLFALADEQYAGHDALTLRGRYGRPRRIAEVLIWLPLEFTPSLGHESSDSSHRLPTRALPERRGYRRSAVGTEY